MTCGFPGQETRSPRSFDGVVLFGLEQDFARCPWVPGGRGKRGDVQHEDPYDSWHLSQSRCMQKRPAMSPTQQTKEQNT